MALIPLNTFKTKTAVLTTKEYNQARCARDTGLIIDSIAFDILYPGTGDTPDGSGMYNKFSQTAFAGEQYWAQSATRIPGEVFQTLAALEHAKDVAVKIVKKETVTVTTGNTQTQVTNGYQAGSSAGVQRVIDEFNLMIDIIGNGISGTTDNIIPNSKQVIDAGLLNTADLLHANKTFLQAEVVAWIDYTFVTNVYPNVSEKCARDTKLIVDSLEIDLLTDGNTQSTFAGLQYWNHDSDTVPSMLQVGNVNEQLQTTAALTRLKTVIPNYTTVDGTNINVNMDTLISIVSNGVFDVTNKIIPNTYTSTPTFQSKATDILNNIDNIKNSVSDWITGQLSNPPFNAVGYTYDPVKCKRDIGYILKCIVYDLLYSGNRQTVQAGVYYFGFNTTTTALPNEVVKSVEAYNYLKSLISSVVTAKPITTTDLYQTATPQVINGYPAGTIVEAAKAETNVLLITDIIQQGDANTVKEPLDITYNPTNNEKYAATLLHANRDFLAAEVVAFVNKPSYVYDQVKCARDTKLLIDSLAFDLLSNGQSQSNFSGLQYWNHDSTTGASIPNEKAQTVSAINHLKELIGQIIINQSISVINTTVSQYVDVANPGNLTSVSRVNDLFTTLLDILNNGTVGITDIIETNVYATPGDGIINASTLIYQNLPFLKIEIVAWINEQIANATSGTVFYTFTYDVDKCTRDVGYILDCIRYDLLYSGNRQTIQAGAYYYGFNTESTAIPNETSVSISAYNHLKSLISDIIQAQPIPKLYKTDYDQVLTLEPGTSVESAKTELNINLINNIIELGTKAANTKEPINISYVPTTNEENAAALLIANKDFLAAEIVAFINNSTTPNFVYNSTKCRRDVGYIVDCVTFDVKHSGNRQAIQAAVRYYDNSATVSIVPSEKQDTINAYKYMSYLISKVIRQHPVNIGDLGTPWTSGGYVATGSQMFYVISALGVTTTYLYRVTTGGNLGSTAPNTNSTQTNGDVSLSYIGVKEVNSDHPNAPYQTTVLQEIRPTTLDHTAVVTKTADTVTFLNRIIETGPSIAENYRLPIDLNPSTDAATVDAWKAIEENREYIIAEVIGYMNTLITPNTTKIYTAPPGVTSIILMAQIANVTDSDINVTFAHYRNFPVIADPATLNGAQNGDNLTVLLNNFTIPSQDSVTPLTGKMILESFDSVVAYANKNKSLHITLSILETANA